jgi:hypothetical protein
MTQHYARIFRPGEYLNPVVYYRYTEADRRDAQIMLDRMRSKLNTRGRHMLGSGLAGFQREVRHEAE